MKKNFEMNMCEGKIFGKLIVYALPLVLTNVLQLLFNAADVAVLGIFVSDDAVAAVGATGALINLIIGLFVGLSVGANVLVARFSGEQKVDSAHKTVGTSVIVSLLTGVILAFIGYFFAGTFLEWTNCDPDVLGMATKYLKIYFIGMPIMMLYNFCASILRAVGDTMRPLIFLIIGGVVNIGLNVFFILVLDKTVEGVAIATVVSQGISAVLSIIVLLKGKGYAKLDMKKFKIYTPELKEMIRIGLPAGLQGCVFSISNVLIQSTINTFSKTYMTANTVAGQFDGFIYNAMNAVALSCLAFVSQNYGAKKFDRIRTVVRQSVLLVTVIGLAIGGGIILFSAQLCGLITDDAEIIRIAQNRLYILASTYFTCGIMDVLSNFMRGLGKSTTAMIVSLSGSCLFRIIWLKTVYLLNPTIEMVYIVYPISWVLTIGVYMIMYFPTLNRAKREIAKAEAGNKDTEKTELENKEIEHRELEEADAVAEAEKC